MKTYQNILAAAALVLGFASCSEDALVQGPQTEQPSVEVTIGANFATTRTTMGADGSVLWSEGDQIKVQVGENAYDFDLASGKGTTSATFRAIVTPADAAILAGTAEGTVTAYYPTSGAAVPATQTYAEGTFADGMNPMTATYANSTLTFTNNAAVVRVQGVSATATSAVLSYTVNSTNYSVTMALTAGSAAKDLYFVVVPGAQDFNLALDDAEAVLYKALAVTEAGSRYNITAPAVKVGDKYYETIEAALAAATAGDEIQLLKDVEITSVLTIGKSVTFDLNNKTLTANVGGRALQLSDNAEVVVKNGTIAIDASKASSSLGLFDVTNGKSLSMTSVAMTGNTADVNGVKSCFIFNDAVNKTISLTSCTGNTNYRIYRNNKGNCTLTVTGGTYTCGGYNVAFQDAGNATYENVTITVDGQGTADYQSGVYVSGGSAVVKNCTISCPNSNKGAITVCVEGTASIEGGSCSGKYGVNVLYSGGVANIKDAASVSGTTYALYVDSRQSSDKYVGTDKTAEIHLNDGTVTGNIGTQHKGKVYVHGGVVNGTVTLTGEGNPIIADGGTFSFDPSNFTVTTTTYTTCVKDGYKAVAQGTDPETWKVVETPATEVATESALRTAISNATAGDKIKLTANITLTSYLEINKALTINLNGKELSTGSMTGNDNPATGYRPIRIGATVSIKDGSINGPSMEWGNSLICVMDNGNLTLSNISMDTPGICATSRTSTSVINIESGTYTSTGSTTSADFFVYCTPIGVMNGAVVNIKGGTFTGKYYAASIYNSGGTINITGGTFNKGTTQTAANEGNLAYALMNDGNNTVAKKGTITISGNPTIHGSFRGRFNNQAGHYGYLNISGGTFDSDCELFNFNQSYITLEGYTITANGECPDKGSSKTTGNGKRWKLTKSN